MTKPFNEDTLLKNCMPENSWGFHLIMDCKECDKKIITDREAIIQFAKEIVKEIDMTPYGEPIVEHFATHDIEKSGFSLVQLIETSAITGHFVDKNGDMYLDIFTCKTFDLFKALHFVSSYFKPKNLKLHYLTRQA